MEISETKGWAEKLQEKRKQALEAQASKTNIIHQLFRHHDPQGAQVVLIWSGKTDV